MQLEQDTHVFLFESRKSYNVLTDGKIFKPSKTDLGGYYLGDYYSYFKKHYKMIELDLRKQQELDSDARAIQQINSTGNLDRQNTAVFFIIEELKENFFDFS